MTYRVGLLVPSSNVTMEIEIPQLLRRTGLPFSFHSARMRMTSVTPEALATMDACSAERASELADAQCDVLAYACLVAVMAQGPGAHRAVEDRLTAAAAGTPVVSSAGALVAAIQALGASRVAMITPYAPALTTLVVDYLRAEDIEVIDEVSLGITDNAAVGRLDPRDLVSHTRRLELRRAEALVVSACVQMPSLEVIGTLRRKTGLPAVSAASATARSLLLALGLPAEAAA